MAIRTPSDHTSECELYRRAYAERYSLRRPGKKICCCRRYR